jgi:hypothetical protein
LTRLRIGLALSGFLLALLSVAYDDRRLAWGAIALLAGSLLVRLWMERRDGPADRGPL